MKFEDDVVVEYVYSMLEDRDKPVSNGPAMGEGHDIVAAETVRGALPDRRLMLATSPN